MMILVILQNYLVCVCLNVLEVGGCFFHHAGPEEDLKKGQNIDEECADVQ